VQKVPSRRSARVPRADEVYIFASRGNYMSESVVITITRVGDTISLSTERAIRFPGARSGGSCRQRSGQSSDRP
jgi:hypothetical protein